MTILKSNFGSKTEYFYCYRLEDYKTLLSELRESELCRAIGLDIETYTLLEYRGKFKDGALDPHTGSISVVTIAAKTSIPIVFDLIALEKQNYDPMLLHDFIESREYVIAHRAQFEIKWLGHYFNKPFFKNFRCTMVLSNILANATGSKFGKAVGHSLKDLVRDMFNVVLKGKGEEQITDWMPRPESILSKNTVDFQNDPAAVSWKSKLDYAVGDVLYLIPIHDQLMPALCNPLPPSPILGGDTLNLNDEEYGLGQKEVVELEMEMLRVSATIEYNGLPTNNLIQSFQRSIYDEVDNCGELINVMAELCEDFGLDYYEDYLSDSYIIPEKSEKILNNPIKLKELLKSTFKLENLDSAQTATIVRLLDLLDQANKLESVNDLEFCSEDEEQLYTGIRELENSVIVKTSEIAQKLIKYKTLKKVHGMNLAKYVNPVTKCVHSNFSQCWAATGRSASSNPNQQNIPGRCYVYIQIEDVDNPFISEASR